MSLFDDYRAIKVSGLFDSLHYSAAFPQIAAANIDPLLHYLEEGWIENANPNASFDAAFYREQARINGVSVDNPLLHYLRVGRLLGWSISGDGKAVSVAVEAMTVSEEELVLFVDEPRVLEGAALVPVQGNLTIIGWAIASSGVDCIEIALDGTVVGSAQHGTRRIDVAEEYPGFPGAAQSGFNGFIPYSRLTPGPHEIELTLIARSGARRSIYFSVESHLLPEGEGPWRLKRRMTRREIDFYTRAIERQGASPHFRLVIWIDPEADFDSLKRTVTSVHAQAYRSFHIILAGSGEDELKQRPELLAQLSTPSHPVDYRCWDASAIPQLIGFVGAGVELGIDALLRVAVAYSSHLQDGLFYADERRPSSRNGEIAAFFKPGWSPDLLLSSNYVGRFFCCTSRAWDRAALSLGEMAGLSDMLFRVSERASGVRHIPAVLFEDADGEVEEAARDALQQTLQRRDIAAEILPGRVDCSVFIRRSLTDHPLVSIIIPTCGARGLIKRCIETLRNGTDYPHIEIICIENVEPRDAELLGWLKRHVTHILSTREPFNWSRYNNLAATAATGELLLFLNDDIEIIDPDWLNILVSEAMRPEVGAVGPQLLYPDRTLQHAGLFLAAPGQGRHAFRYATETEAGAFGLAQVTRNVIAVTGACLLTRREVFEAVGRFDERQSVINNDLDFCLRLHERGLWTLYQPNTRLIHHELASREHLGDAFDASSFTARWAAVFRQGDPFLNPALLRDRDDLVADPEPVRRVFSGAPLIALTEIRRILVVKLDHLGDCLTALPAIARLKNHCPKAEITVLSASFAKAVWSLDPAIDGVITFDWFEEQSNQGRVSHNAAALSDLQSQLTALGFDLAIDLRKVPDAREILQLTGATWLAGFDSDGRFPWLDIAIEWEKDRARSLKHQPIADDLIRLVDAVALACATPPKSLTKRDGETLICIHPFVGNPIRQWPVGHFIDLIAMLLDAYDVRIAVLGGSRDIEAALEIVRTIDHAAVISLAGQGSFMDLRPVLEKAALFIGNDSGPKHLASLLGVPTISIQSGVVDPGEWGPTAPDSVGIYRAVTCAPCYLERAQDCPRARDCLTGLAPSHVFDLCQTMLGSVARRRIGSDASLTASGRQ